MSVRSVVTLSRFQADLSRALARRGEKLLESRDLASEVAKLEPLEAYFIVKELGVHDAGAILRHATPEQLQTFVDLDCWRDDRPDADEIDAWLTPFQAEGKEELAAAFGRLDEELQTLFLAAIMNIYDARSPEEIPEAPESVVRRTTVDSFFVLEPIPSEVREVDPLVLVDALYSADVNHAFSLLTAARWELPGELEESAYRFRTARLEDLGFPSREQALRIFASPAQRPPTSVKRARPLQATLPALYASSLREESLIARALSRVQDEHLLAELEEALLALINSAVIAFNESPRDLGHVHEVAGRVRDTLSLGLEALLSPDEPLAAPQSDQVAATAADLLASWPLLEVFRHGSAETRRLGAQAQELAEDPVVAHWLAQSDEGASVADRLDRAFLRGLLGLPPLYAGVDPLRPAAARAFGSKRELAEAESRLDALAARLR